MMKSKLCRIFPERSTGETIDRGCGTDGAVEQFGSKFAAWLQVTEIIAHFTLRTFLYHGDPCDFFVASGRSIARSGWRGHLLRPSLRRRRGVMQF